MNQGQPTCCVEYQYQQSYLQHEDFWRYDLRTFVLPFWIFWNIFNRQKFVKTMTKDFLIHNTFAALCIIPFASIHGNAIFCETDDEFSITFRKLNRYRFSGF